MTADLSEPPWLMLLFKNRGAAQKIFAGFQAELGKEDLQERLRISIITGVDKDNPAFYRAIVSENPASSDPTSSEENRSRQVVIISRINSLTPGTSRNLDTFLARYERVKKYVLLPGAMTPNGPSVLAPSLGILKRELNVRPAWQVGRHDSDASAIDADDKIIIPEGITNAPVLEALAWKKKSRDHNFAAKRRRNEPSLRASTTAGQKIGRNDPCPCGSGRKYKKCHGK